MAEQKNIIVTMDILKMVYEELKKSIGSGGGGTAGVGIDKITTEATTNGGLTGTKIIITLTNGSTSEFIVYDGQDGSKGKDGNGISHIVTANIVEVDGTVTGQEIKFVYTNSTISDPINIYYGKDGAPGAPGKTAYESAISGGLPGSISEGQFNKNLASVTAYDKVYEAIIARLSKYDGEVQIIGGSN